MKRLTIIFILFFPAFSFAKDKSAIYEASMLQYSKEIIDFCDYYCEVDTVKKVFIHPMDNAGMKALERLMKGFSKSFNKYEKSNEKLGLEKTAIKEREDLLKEEFGEMYDHYYKVKDYYMEMADEYDRSLMRLSWELNDIKINAKKIIKHLEKNRIR